MAIVVNAALCIVNCFLIVAMLRDNVAFDHAVQMTARFRKEQTKRWYAVNAARKWKERALDAEQRAWEAADVKEAG